MKLADTTSMIRSVFPTSPSLTQTVLEFVTDVSIDNRAVGYRATTVGGREASFEPLAELVVHHDLEMEISSVLQDPELLALVFDDLFPKKETLKLTSQQGLTTMPMLIKSFTKALNRSTISATAASALAHVLAELTAHSLRHLNLILPFDGVVSITSHHAIFPNVTTICEAARIARVTTILESLKLDPEIGRVKTLSAMSLLTALQPMFARAGRQFIMTVDQDEDLKDAFLLLSLFLKRDPALPKELLDNDDLKSLSANLTYVLAAVALPYRELSIQPYRMERVLSNATMNLRSLKRFSTKHLSEVKDWYVHYTLQDSPGQRVVGLLFGRNMVLENRPQVTVFTQVGSAQNPLWTQTPFAVAENRVEPLLTKLFAEELHCQKMAAVVAGVATYAGVGDDEATVILANAATEIELMHYAASLSRNIMLSINDGNEYTISFLNEETELNYSSQSSILGTRIVSQDPAEAIIHSGFRESLGSGSVPSRIQGIPDNARQALLLNNPEQFTLNVGAPFTIKIALEDDLTLTFNTNLSQLLVLPEQLRLSLTQPISARDVVTSHIDLLLHLADSADVTTKTGEICRIRAATALSNFLLAISTSPAGRAMVRSVMLGLVSSVPRGVERDKLRGRLRNATVSYQVALEVAARILIATGITDSEGVTAIVDLVNATGLDRYMVGSTQNLHDLI